MRPAPGFNCLDGGGIGVEQTEGRWQPAAGAVSKEPGQDMIAARAKTCLGALGNCLLGDGQSTCSQFRIRQRHLDTCQCPTPRDGGVLVGQQQQQQRKGARGMGARGVRTQDCD
jgi:hypothetical protein